MDWIPGPPRLSVGAPTVWLGRVAYNSRQKRAFRPDGDNHARPASVQTV